MRIVLADFMSLDGVVQAPGGPEEDTDGDFAHGGWSMRYFDPETMGAAINDAMSRTEALLFGRRTWQVMAAAWPGRAGDPFADRMNEVTKYVVSATLSSSDLYWNNSVLLAPDDLVRSLAALREAPGGDIQVMGSARLARTLVGHGLVDEYRLMIEPVILGGGKRLFPDDGTLRGLELRSATTTKTGVQVCIFHPAAEE
jgi:dihydrofolate reductase